MTAMPISTLQSRLVLAACSRLCSSPVPHSRWSRRPSLRGEGRRRRNLFPLVVRCHIETTGDSAANGIGFSSSCGRRSLIFLAAVPYIFPPQQFAEVVNEGNLVLIQSRLRKVLSKARAAGFLRLAFHDAGTFDMYETSGGMNGSIVYELDRPENAGLSKSIQVLDKVKAEIDKIHHVSWADMIAVAGAEAVSLCGGPSIPIRLGRIDTRRPDPEEKLPSESLDAFGLKRCFLQKGFSTQELVVLSGAHTLGSKGFGNPNLFDNSYFKVLLEKPWASSGGMSNMIGLPTDRALVEDDECLRWVKMYARDEARFFSDFRMGYIKLVNSGASWSS